jgi:hypothetical protein
VKFGGNNSDDERLAIAVLPVKKLRQAKSGS